MIFGWFRRKRAPIPELLHAELIAAARRPVFFAELGVPDTVDGRFEMLSLHLFLFLRRGRAEPALAELTQEVLDRTFADLDRNLREAGVSDLTVPKKMKQLAGQFYARVSLYATPLEAGDAEALAAALRRTALADSPEGDANRLAHYVIRAGAVLAAQPAGELLAGTIAFVEP
jgi:cytochrome b pre-mRNA-processing protein 3